MTRFEEVVALARQLNLSEKYRLIEEISASMTHDLDSNADKNMSWREFIDQTAGSLADDPIERPAQLPLDKRESIE